MELERTRALIRDAMNTGLLDACAVIVSCRGEKAAVFSPGTDEDTLFDIASMGKVLVTAPLILQLTGEGALSLDSTLGELLAQCPGDKKAITIRQLLTHTSGILRYTFPPDIGLGGHEAVLDFILHSEPGSRPGEKSVYSCNGMVLLGLILEKVTGLGLEDLWKSRLKEPLGLRRSTFLPDPGERNAAACCHLQDPGDMPFDDVNVRSMRGNSGAGGQFFTAGDIARYCEAILDRSPVLYPEYLYDAAERDYTPNAEEGRGLGWLITDRRYPQTDGLFPDGSFGHTGWTGTSFFMNRDTEMYAVVLTNSMRWTYIREGFAPENPAFATHQLRTRMHHEIHMDLLEQGIIR